jgi:hypothetical protein
LTANHAIYRVESFRIVCPFTMHVRFDEKAEQTIDFGRILEVEIDGFCAIENCSSWSE